MLENQAHTTRTAEHAMCQHLATQMFTWSAVARVQVFLRVSQRLSKSLMQKPEQAMSHHTVARYWLHDYVTI